MTIKTQKILQRAELLSALSSLPPQSLIGIYEVSVLFGLSEETIRRARNRNPKLIPAPLINCSLLRWRLGDILNSIDDQPTRNL